MCQFVYILMQFVSLLIHEIRQNNFIIERIYQDIDYEFRTIRKNPTDNTLSFT